MLITIFWNSRRAMETLKMKKLYVCHMQPSLISEKSPGIHFIQHTVSYKTYWITVNFPLFLLRSVFVCCFHFVIFVRSFSFRSFSGRLGITHRCIWQLFSLQGYQYCAYKNNKMQHNIELAMIRSNAVLSHKTQSFYLRKLATRQRKLSNWTEIGNTQVVHFTTAIHLRYYPHCL